MKSEVRSNRGVELGIVFGMGHIKKGAVTAIISDNSTMTAQLAATGKVVLFEGFKEHVLPFLDITPIMPPERLRWSRLLKRPLMERMDDAERTIDIASLYRRGAPAS